MKRVVAGVATGLLLGALVATAGAQALWSSSERLDDGVSVAGDLSVSATWPGGTPAWGPLFPGAAPAEATLHVASAGAGTTLRWRLTVTSSVAANAVPYVQFTAWAGACGTGTTIPPGGYPAGSTLAPGAAVDVCVRYALAADAPGTLQGAALVPSITVTANQVGG